MLSSSESEDEQDHFPADESMHIPSIGPPAILQYFKESQHPPFISGELDEDSQGKEFLKKSLFTGPCMFCKNEVLPFPTEEELENVEISSQDVSNIYVIASMLMQKLIRVLSWEIFKTNKHIFDTIFGQQD